DEIRRKINGAFCPVKETEVNPIIDLIRYVIFPYLNRKGEEFKINNIKTNQSMTFSDLASLESAYSNGAIHPADLKANVSEYMIKILEPARKFFLEGNGRKYMEEMETLKITR
ncbi:MAG: tyrosine--tRNA ligase, partial [Candidatus Micrarchaeia archaeon]